jgi:phosphoglycolate phosphatase-like HAD superfamily hydrolase
MVEAMTAVWGVPAVPDDIWRVEPAGRTDREIARMVLHAHGVPDGDIDARTVEWMALAVEIHDRVITQHPVPIAAPDADSVAGRLRTEGADVALVTGNLEEIGRAKVAAAGLAHHFAPGRGGFGSDAELRADLVRLARARAEADHADHEVVVVGDTPRDIAAARAAGVRVIGVTTGAHDARALADADAVVPDLSGALAVLLA